MSIVVKKYLIVLIAFGISASSLCDAGNFKHDYEKVFKTKNHHMWIMGRSHLDPLVIPANSTSTEKRYYAIVLSFRKAKQKDTGMDPNGDVINKGDIIVDFWGYSAVNIGEEKYTDPSTLVTYKCTPRPSSTEEDARPGVIFKINDFKGCVTRRYSRRGDKELIVRFLPQSPPTGGDCEEPPVEDIYEEEPMVDPNDPGDELEYYDPPYEPPVEETPDP